MSSKRHLLQINCMLTRMASGYSELVRLFKVSKVSVICTLHVVQIWCSLVINFSGVSNIPVSVEFLLMIYECMILSLTSEILTVH